MIKNMAFVFSRTYKNIGFLFLSALTTLTTFFIYLAPVLIQNSDFSSGDIMVQSGLVHGFYQEMVMFILNGFTVLFLVISVYVTPKTDGIELVIISKKNTRLSLFTSRLLVCFISIVFITGIQSIFLLGVSHADNILSSDDINNWLYSKILGILLVNVILVAIFISLATLLKVIMMLVFSTTLIVAFPMISFMVYSINSPSTKELDKFKTEPVGLYASGHLTPDNVMPDVIDGKLVYNHLPLKTVKEKYINFEETNSEMSLQVLLKQVSRYDNNAHYDRFQKIDAWNSIHKMYSLFSPTYSSNSYIHNKYIKHSIANLIPNEESYMLIADKKITTITSHSTTSHNTVWEFKNFKRNMEQKTSHFMSENMKYVINYLDTHDFFASEYKRLTFLKQVHFWQDIINYFDYTTDDIEHYFTNMPTPPNAPSPQLFTDSWMYHVPVDNYDYNFGFYEAKMMADKDFGRYAPTRLLNMPQEGLLPSPSRLLTASSNSYVYNKEEEPYDRQTPWIYILPSIAGLLLIVSTIVFMKKDIK